MRTEWKHPNRTRQDVPERCGDNEKGENRPFDRQYKMKYYSMISYFFTCISEGKNILTFKMNIYIF